MAPVPLYETPAGVRVIVATCGQFEETLGKPVSGCVDGVTRLASANLQIAPPPPLGDAPSDPIAEAVATAPTLEIPAVDDNDFNGVVLAPPDNDLAHHLRDTRPTNWYVAIPGPDVDALVLDQLALVPGTRVSPSNLSLIDRSPDPGGRWVLVGALAALILGTIGFGIGAIEVATATRARTRHLAVLGASARVISATQLRELTWPLVAGCISGSCAGLVASWAYTRIVDVGAIDATPIALVLSSALGTAMTLVIIAVAASGRHRFDRALNTSDD